MVFVAFFYLLIFSIDNIVSITLFRTGLTNHIKYYSSYCPGLFVVYILFLSGNTALLSAEAQTKHGMIILHTAVCR